MNAIWDLANNEEKFEDRHIGLSRLDIETMVNFLGYNSIDALVDSAVPKIIQDKSPINIPAALSEHEALSALRKKTSKNKVFRSLLGMGYASAITPSVIKRNVLENPGWYTQYTPYQAEISQGRLEILFFFQTMIADLTKLPVANASLLDEGTSAVEAMNLAFFSKKKDQTNTFFVSESCHPQTIAMLVTRAEPLNINLCIENHNNFDFSKKPFGILLQYPQTNGTIENYRSLIDNAHHCGAIATVAADLMSLTLLVPPGEFGADIVVGSTQRFGLPMAFGGPHAGFFAIKEDLIRRMPGRLVGLSKDCLGRPAYRLTLATREQHIRREKATSNICTAQALPAILSTFYSIYHGPNGLRRIANKIHALTSILSATLQTLGLNISSKYTFDTVLIKLQKNEVDSYLGKALALSFNFRKLDAETLSISLDEESSLKEISSIVDIFNSQNKPFNLQKIAQSAVSLVPDELRRKSHYLTHEVFNRYHSEMELQRFIKKLENRDLSLTRSMIPLGSCTMKLNAASEMIPITWPEISALHPFAPLDQAKGSLEINLELESLLSHITGFDAVSLQPNSGAQGELTGLLVIRKYLKDIGQSNRNICLIPSSAHGTNPASATFAGFKTVEVACDKNGNIDISDLRNKAESFSANLAAIMVTYPSTHGVFEEGIVELCKIVHECGGQVYMDGANLQAQIGLCFAGKIGPDVCHMNLHKTFAIPHGGGGPGVGPIAVKNHLIKYLPKTPLSDLPQSIGTISSAPWGSAGVLPISWMYIRMMGQEGLPLATKVSILSANYIKTRLEQHYPTVYKGNNNLVAHECILDIRPIKKSCGIDETDIAKRLMDYGFHAPTISWPVVGTMMVEPTESESKYELDRFCDAMISIREEIKEIEEGKADKENNLLKNAPHTQHHLLSWDKPYDISRAAFPDSHTVNNKFWAYSGRVDAAFGDRNLVCTCS